MTMTAFFRLWVQPTQPWQKLFNLGLKKNQQGTLSYSNTQVDHRLLWRDSQKGIDCVLTSDES